MRKLKIVWKSCCILLAFFTVSCASIANQPYTTVTVHTTQSTRVIINNDTLSTVNNTVSIPLLRKNEAVRFSTITDTIVTEGFMLKPRNSGAFYGNLFLSFPGLVGLVIDWRNPKRYTYKKNVYLNSADTIAKEYDYEQSDKKGDYYLNVSIPYVNWLRVKPIGEPEKHNSGFWGFAVGADYYYKNNRFANLTVGAATDFFLPVIAAVHSDGETEMLTSTYVSASDNFQFGRFSVGYGVSFARNGWRYLPDSTLPESQQRRAVSKYSNSAGLLAASSLRLGSKFHVGLTYKPYLMRFSRTNIFDYQHLISLELMWKFRI